MPLSNRLCFQINLRDRLACSGCGRRPTTQEQYHRGFEYHHRVPISQGGPDTLDNLLLLCHACHRHWHQDPETILPDPAVLLPEVPTACCGHRFSPDTVTMNCGWYQCSACQRQIHLFEHFYGGHPVATLKPVG